MADWPGWWRFVRDCVERSDDGRVVFTVGEIVAGARSVDRNCQQRSWWNAVLNPTNESHTGVIENGMVAAAIGILKKEREPAIDQILRKYRNFIHPLAEIRGGIPCTEAEALLAKGALDSVCNDLDPGTAP